MPTITVIEFNGRDHTIDAEAGKSLMENVMNNAVPGIDADCGGACACGTCHCFIADEWQPTTGDADAMEEAMLGMRPQPCVITTKISWSDRACTRSPVRFAGGGL